MYRSDFVVCTVNQFRVHHLGGPRGSSSGRGSLRAWPAHMHTLHGMTGGIHACHAYSVPLTGLHRSAQHCKYQAAVNAGLSMLKLHCPSYLAFYN